MDRKHIYIGSAGMSWKALSKVKYFDLLWPRKVFHLKKQHKHTFQVFHISYGDIVILVPVLFVSAEGAGGDSVRL